MNAHGRQLPPVAVALVVVQVGGFAYGLSRITKLSHHVVLVLIVVVLAALWLAAVVVWRQRWAWWLYVLLYVVAVISPAWQEWSWFIPYALDVLTLALLVSRSMRRYVGVGGIGRRLHRTSAR